MNRPTPKNRRHLAARSRYQLKRRSPQYVRRRANRLEDYIKGRRAAYHEQERKQSAPYVHHVAPPNFSLIDNTNAVLAYFNEGEALFNKKNRVTFDVGQVTALTPDTIALMVASIHTEDYTHGYGYRGNEPFDEGLAKLFKQSGFYKFVRTELQSSGTEANMLHKERNHKVEPDIALRASLLGVQNSFQNSNPFEPLYEIIIECMSNSNNHANPKKQGGCYWWLFVYSDPDTRVTSYSFVDLGVGIFGSMHVRGIFKRLGHKAGITKNIAYADDLLEGKIHSRMDQDREIRGKGIPQIVGYAKLPEFRRFNLITNDVFFDLKNGHAVELNSTMPGTFLYWELGPTNIADHGNQGDHIRSQGLQ